MMVYWCREVAKIHRCSAAVMLQINPKRACIPEALARAYDDMADRLEDQMKFPLLPGRPRPNIPVGEWKDWEPPSPAAIPDRAGADEFVRDAFAEGPIGESRTPIGVAEDRWDPWLFRTSDRRDNVGALLVIAAMVALLVWAIFAR